MSLSESLKLSIAQLLLMKFLTSLEFTFVIILVKIITFFPEKQLWITNFGFVDPYLKEEGDPEYFWMNEYNVSGLLFP